MRVVNKSLCYKSFDKKIAILLVFIFSSVCLSKELSIYDLTKREGIYYEKATDVPYTGELIIRYTSGKVSTIKNYRKGILHGAYEMYHIDGKLLERGTYKNGKLDGAYESYWYNGQILVKGSYKNAKVDGLYEMYHRNGELEVKRIYKNGIEISCEGKCN